MPSKKAKHVRRKVRPTRRLLSGIVFIGTGELIGLIHLCKKFVKLFKYKNADTLALSKNKRGVYYKEGYCMDTEKINDSHTLHEDENIGAVKIGNDVVATIAGIAAAEVEGVFATAGNIPNELMCKVGVKNLAKGVKVEIKDKTVSVELSLVLEYGFGIPETSKRVQDRVKSTVENMTGFEVTSVNIRIAGVNMQK